MMRKNKMLNVLACGLLAVAVVVAVSAMVEPNAVLQAELVWPIGNAPVR
ncbi:hypothetical protein [Tumebacillus algifaecis]|nr:hypothetical protein [Tumebacillus algifaecis]